MKTSETTVEPTNNKGKLLLCSILIGIIGFFTYAKGYSSPANLFWDENYHIASAQKYLDGVFFMELHPPLGKLFIALGEKLVNPNAGLDVSPYHKVDHLKKTPKGYSFAGVRLFPVIFAWLSTILLFFLFYTLVPRPFLAACFSSLILFDNTLIVHSRAAMLDSSQLFFVLLFLIRFFVVFKREKPASKRDYLGLSLIAGLALAVKLNSAILLLLFVVLYFNDEIKTTSAQLEDRALRLVLKASISALTMLVVLGSAYFAHFKIATKVVDKRYYKVTAEHKAVLRGETTGLIAFKDFLVSTVKYTARYNKGVPRLRPDSDKENGSHPVFWPLGKKSISYRWSKTEDGKVRHLRLQCNPIIWFYSLLSILLCFILVGARYIFSLKDKEKPDELLAPMGIFLALYLWYMCTMMIIGRVMYLYHYFIPLILSFCMAYLLFNYLFAKAIENNDGILKAGLAISLASIVMSFLFFSPFTYYIPIDAEEFMRRDWFSIWRLKLVLW